MQRSYGVVWREGDRPLVAGKLELLPQVLRLEGRDRLRDIPYEGLAGVHVGRSAADRIEGRPSVVVERRGGGVLTIATVAQSNLIGEITERLTELQLGAQQARRLVVVLPLKRGAQDEVRALLDEGPPFDPEAIQGLDRHEVFLTPNEVVFLFESGLGTNTLSAMLSQPEIWQAVSAWYQNVDGPPRVAEDVFSWSRVDGEGDVYFLPTPGPGDSDGGDIY